MIPAILMAAQIAIPIAESLLSPQKDSKGSAGMPKDPNKAFADALSEALEKLKV